MIGIYYFFNKKPNVYKDILNINYLYSFNKLLQCLRILGENLHNLAVQSFIRKYVS